MCVLLHTKKENTFIYKVIRARELVHYSLNQCGWPLFKRSVSWFKPEDGLFIYLATLGRRGHQSGSWQRVENM